MGFPFTPTRSSHSKPSNSSVKSLYKQLAFSTVGLANGSYSPSDAHRRTNVESTTIKSLDDKKKKKRSENTASSKQGAVLTSIKTSGRRYSADDDASVIVLPVKTMDIFAAHQLDQHEYLLRRTRVHSEASSHSAPCSPRGGRKTASEILSSDDNDNLNEVWTQSPSGYTFSRKRAFRKNLKSSPVQSKFYIDSSFSDVEKNEINETSPPKSNLSKFSIYFLSPLTKRKNKRSSKSSSKTLPSKLVPDYSQFADTDNLPTSPNPSEASHCSDNVFDDELHRTNSLKNRNNRPSYKNYGLTLPPRITVQNSTPTKENRLSSNSSSVGSSDSESSENTHL